MRECEIKKLRFCLDPVWVSKVCLQQYWALGFFVLGEWSWGRHNDLW